MVAREIAMATAIFGGFEGFILNPSSSSRLHLPFKRNCPPGMALEVYILVMMWKCLKQHCPNSLIIGFKYSERKGNVAALP